MPAPFLYYTTRENVMEAEQMTPEEAVQEERFAKEFTVPDSSYLKLGEHIYSIKKVNKTGVDIEAELREFYGQKYKEFTEQVVDVVGDDAVNEWHTQLDHVNRYRTRGNITIPPDLQGLPCIFIAGEVVQLRPFLYEPIEYSCSRSQLINWGIPDNSSVFDGIPTGNPDIIVTLKKAPLKVTLFCGHSRRQDELFVPISRTFHTFSDSKICRGDHSAEAYWNLGDEQFALQMSKTNCFSLATNDIRHQGMTTNIRNVLNDADNIASITRRPQGGDQWTT